MSPKIMLYSFYDRLWHWFQALIGVALIVTGFEISYGSHFTILGFDKAVAIHNVAAVLLAANAGLALFYNLASGLLVRYVPGIQDFLHLGLKHAEYYLIGIFRGDPHPFDKTPEKRLLPLQKIAYFGILNFLLPFMIVTGILKTLANYDPALIDSLGGLTILGPLHRFGAWLFLAFLIVHIYMITTGPTLFANLKAMIAGYETAGHAAGEE
jgi:thiosulfate reductase cytochrome b subunit